MVVKIKLLGEQKVIRILGKLPIALTRESKNKIGEFARFVQKSAKLRAPRFTGQLADSIKVTSTGKRDVEVVVDSNYGIYQELGFTPHWIHRDMPSKGGYRVSDWMVANNVPPKVNFIYVRKNKPFIRPALTEGLRRFPEMLSQATKQAIKSAGG